MRLRQIRYRLALAISGIFASAIYTILSWSAIGAEVRQSSFFGLLRLVGSDSDIVLANAKDLALGLLESLPLETVLLALVLCFSALAALLLVSAMRSERRILNHSL